MVNEQSKLAKDFKRVFDDLSKQQDLERKGLKEEKRDRKSMGGLMDKAIYYTNKVIPNVLGAINKIRKGFNDGGVVDENSAAYLLSVLNGGMGLSRDEIEALKELLKELDK